MVEGLPHDHELMDEIEELTRRAARERTRGIAVGMLMERHGVPAGAALERLEQCAHECGLPVDDVALTLVRTRSLPG